MTIRTMVLVATVSWLLLLAPIGWSLKRAADADDAIRSGLAQAALLGCQENNERWQLLLDFANRQNPGRKVTPAEQRLIDQLVNRDCSQVRQRYLDRTAP
jgi:cytochrome c-type biogenesis protein CcmH/NrfG